MEALPELRVPYGCPETGPLVPVEAAVRGVRYTCPGCATRLVLKDSAAKRRRKHFSHPSTGACSQESIFHSTAKRLLVEVIREHVAGKGEGISLRLNCPGCTQPFKYPIPRDKFTDAAEERTMSRYRCDVVGLHGSDVKLAIEVQYTHATGDTKAAALSAPMIEVQALDVLSNPYLWIPVSHTLKRTRCDKCKAQPATAVVASIVAPAVRPTIRKPVRTAVRPAPRPAPAPAVASKPGNVTLQFMRSTETLRPFSNERELKRYLRNGGTLNRQPGKPRF